MRPRWPVAAGIAWRFALLGGATAGLALASAAPPSEPVWPLLAAAAAALVAVAGLGPRAEGAALAAWLALLALAAAGGGVAVGCLRIAAIDHGAFDGRTSRPVTARGFVTAVPRRSDGEVRVRIETPDGQLTVQAHEPIPDLAVGRGIAAEGTLRDPEPWESSYLARYGIREVLVARRLRLTGAHRAGLAGVIDGIRDRAESALTRGTPGPEAALLRGFVLGEDDRIDPATVEDFKRSGLAHLLAVSGDCVMLLALLGAVILGVCGVPFRARLLSLVALIAIYIPVTGAAPSIQRAGIMGIAGLVATLAGRPRSRWYAVLLAAAATLTLNPRWVSDPSWQLSFAAVVGILLFAPGIRDLLLGSPGARPPSRLRRAVAEGAAVTVAATVSTAPLFAHDFGTVSLASLPANLLALPAVPFVMWLSMLAAIVGQVPGVPVEPLTALAGVLVAYVAQVARWLAAPGWAQVGLTLPGWGAVAMAYAVVWPSMGIALAWARRRGGFLPPAAHRRALALAAALIACAALIRLAPVGRGDAAPPSGLRVTVLDVGQGDSILLDPPDGGPVLVDGGPPGDDLAAHLERDGVSRLSAAVVTHDQADHVGGIDDLLGTFPVRRLIYAEPGADFLRDARTAGVPVRSIAEGSQIASGSLRLDVLWPPRPLLDGPPPDDPNQAALVLVARWRDFSMLLTADAEAESVPIDPGPVDVLKVAHHGSDDAGLDALLGRTVPRLAVISVGAGNPYGHPTPETLSTLASHGVPILRTDENGDVTIDATAAGWWAKGGD